MPYSAVRRQLIVLCANTFATLLSLSLTHAADFDPAAKATNQVGFDLFRQMAKSDENLCLSPYSIQTALAMTYAGAAGDTRSEMSRVLHFPPDETTQASFLSLQKSLEEAVHSSANTAAQSKKFGGPSEPISLSVANRLFPQKGYALRQEFIGIMQRFYGGNLEALDFKANADAARKHINGWVSQQTHDRILDLIPPNGVDATTRLVLANALYFKAPWQKEFSEGSTKPAGFRVRGNEAVDVPTMRSVEHLGYLHKGGWTIVALPYVGSDLRFLVLLPDDAAGAKNFSNLTTDALPAGRKFEDTLVDLSLPRFKFSSATLPLARFLKTLGLRTVFDQPPGSANFDRMAPRKPNDYLAISEVFHKTFIAVDEKGTEAAAATAVSMVAGALAMPDRKPAVVKVDRPFIFAIQHVPSGACLFLGQVVDPR